MKRIDINHLRVIKRFTDKEQEYKISDYEKFLSDYVSIPTARKIIKDLIEFNIVKVIKSKDDLRVKNLKVIDGNIDKYLWSVTSAELYNIVNDLGVWIWGRVFTPTQQ